MLITNDRLIALIELSNQTKLRDRPDTPVNRYSVHKVALHAETEFAVTRIIT